jgi:hypothetical protein
VAGLKVDVGAIHLLTRHLRMAAAELTPDLELLTTPHGVFESPVESALATTNADLGRQSSALAEFVTSLAEAGDRTATQLLEADAELASGSAGGR